MRKNCKSRCIYTRKGFIFPTTRYWLILVAIIGPTVKGPAFVPTQVTSFSEFENIFGGLDTRFYVPYTVKEYIKNVQNCHNSSCLRNWWIPTFIY